MRLPTVTEEQQKHEEARAHHEELYGAFLSSTPLVLPVTPQTWLYVMNAESSNGRRFWTKRGFRIRTKVNPAKTVLSVWLEQVGMTDEQARVYREARRAEIAARAVQGHA